MMDGFTVFMAVACIVSLMVIAFLITIFVILCIRTVDPSMTNEFPSVGVGTGGGYNYVTNLSSVADEYDDMSDEEQGIQHINDDDIGCYGYGYSGSGVSKFTTVLIDNIFPTAKTSIIGKEVGEFELLTSSSV